MATKRSIPTDTEDTPPITTDTLEAAPVQDTAPEQITEPEIPANNQDPVTDTPESPAPSGNVPPQPQRMVRVKVLKHRMIYDEFEHARGIYLSMPEDRAKAKELIGEVTTDI